MLAVPTDERFTEFLSANVDALDEAGRTPHPFGASTDVTVAAQGLDGERRVDELLMSVTLVDVSTGAYQLLRLAAPRASTPLGANGVLSFQPADGEEAPDEEGGLWPEAGDLVGLAENWVAALTRAAPVSDVEELRATGQDMAHLTAGLEEFFSAGPGGTDDEFAFLTGGTDVSGEAAELPLEGPPAVVGTSRGRGGRRGATGRGQMAEASAA